MLVKVYGSKIVCQHLYIRPVVLSSICVPLAKLLQVNVESFLLLDQACAPDNGFLSLNRTLCAAMKI